MFSIGERDGEAGGAAAPPQFETTGVFWANKAEIWASGSSSGSLLRAGKISIQKSKLALTVN